MMFCSKLTGILVLSVVGLCLAWGQAAHAQGCTAARGCPTLPPSLPRASAGQTRSEYNLLLANNFYASAEASDARPAAPQATDAVPANKALIRVSVPSEDAIVSFQGVASAQQGKQRQFASPALAAGRDYRYVIRCVWKEGGRELSREQRVIVRPGQETTVDFLAAR